MAWRIKIVDVTWIDTYIDNDTGETVNDDLSETGRYKVHAQFGDSAEPDVVLWENDFVFYKDEVSSTEALDVMKAAGREVRDTREVVTDLEIHEGNTFPID